MKVASSFILALLLANTTLFAANPPLLPTDETEFAKLIAPDATVTKLGGQMKFLEGPVWIKAGYLLFSDSGSDCINKWTEADGIKVFRQPAHFPNGNTTDNQGRLITCAQNIHAVVRTEADGTETLLLDNIDGKRFNSPNDIQVKSDDSIWFTDPPYGMKRGEKAQLNYHGVFCFDPATQKVAPVATDIDMPNGLTFSPDEKKLYVADSGKGRQIFVFDVNADHTLSNKKLFCKIDKGGPDGIRTDSEGRVWSSAGDGVHIFTTEGKLIGKILVPETPANLRFGGAEGHTLFITARSGLYKIETKAVASAGQTAPVVRH